MKRGEMTNGGNVLITGGGGLIGGFAAKRLLDQGCDVTVIDTARIEAGCLPAIGAAEHPRLRYVQGSVMDDRIWEALPRDFTHVVHAASVKEAENEPREQIAAMDLNIIGTRMCLQCARELPRLERFLYLSASEIYGSAAVNVSEETPAVIRTHGARWCYAAAKLSAEFYVRAFTERFGAPHTIVRPFNVYGPASCCRTAVTVMVRRAVANEAISICRTGEQTRAWCHVNDIVDGLTECLFNEASRNETFNLGADCTASSVLELARLICSRVGSKSPVVVLGGAEPDVPARLPNISKARQRLGYRPRIGLEDGIDDVARWARRLQAEEAAQPAARAG
jgi:UDP-glucose 4-epimerase